MTAIEQWELYIHWIVIPMVFILAVVALTMIWPTWIYKFLGFFDPGYDYENDREK